VPLNATVLLLIKWICRHGKIVNVLCYASTTFTDVSKYFTAEPRLKLPITEDTLKKAMKLGAERVKELKLKESSQIRLSKANYLHLFKKCFKKLL